MNFISKKERIGKEKALLEDFIYCTFYSKDIEAQKTEKQKATKCQELHPSNWSQDVSEEAEGVSWSPAEPQLFIRQSQRNVIARMGGDLAFVSHFNR